MRQNSWGRWIIILHWLTALTVIGLFAVGLWMVDLNYYNDWYKTAPHYHKSVGLMLAALTLVRLVLRMIQSRPAPLGQAWEQHLSAVVHGLIYLLLITLFVSGYLISTADGRGIELFNWFTVPGLGAFIQQQEDIAGQVHFYVAWGLIILAALHGLAAVKHHVLDKDATLTRMLKP